MTSPLVWVVCWRRRGTLPTLPIIGPLHAGCGRPPVAFYLRHSRSRGSWFWTSKPEKATTFRTPGEAERARENANATGTSAVCCVSASTLRGDGADGKGKGQ